jgi:ubiquinone/menaquinone biosynthesis C-methylase UbiE
MLVGNSGDVLRLPVRFHPGKPHSSHEFAFLERRFTPRTVFMEVGAADCDLALQAASYVERVYAIDVSGHFIQNVLVPCNLRLVLCDGVRIPVPAASVDVAWGGAFMDQLHPDDADEHLRNVRRALVAGGEYVCRTGGSPREVAERMIAAGFLRVRYYAGNLRVPGFSVLPSSLLRIAAIK